MIDIKIDLSVNIQRLTYKKKTNLFQNNLKIFIFIKRRNIESVLQITLLSSIKIQLFIENAIKFYSFFSILQYIKDDLKTSSPLRKTTFPSLLKIQKLKMSNHSLPLQTSTGKEGSSCWDAQTGRDCFLCSIVPFI